MSVIVTVAPLVGVEDTRRKAGVACHPSPPSSPRPNITQPEHNTPHLTQGAKLREPATATQQCLGVVSQRAHCSDSHASEGSRFPVAIPDWAARAPERRAFWGERSISVVMGGAMRAGCAAPAAAGCAEEVQRRSWCAVERWARRSGLAWRCLGLGGRGPIFLRVRAGTKDWGRRGYGRSGRGVHWIEGIGISAFVVLFCSPF